MEQDVEQDAELECRWALGSGLGTVAIVNSGHKMRGT